MKIAITGITGFIAQNLAKSLFELNENQKLTIIGYCRDKNKLKQMNVLGGFDLLTLEQNYGLELVELDLGEQMPDFEGTDVVIHTAGLAHRDFAKEEKSNSLYDEVNTEMTILLTKAALKAQVKQFIFLSTIKVYDENLKRIALDSPIKPTGAYAHSKLHAERAIEFILKKTNTSYCIIRLPLIYGVGVKAHFAELWRTVSKASVLPTGCLDDAKTMFSVDNLAHFIHTIILNEDSFNQTFLPSDDKSLTLSQWVQKIAEAQNKKVIQVPIPKFFIQLILKILQKEKLARRVLNCEQILSDYGKLKWQAPFSIEQSLKKIAKNIKN